MLQVEAAVERRIAVIGSGVLEGFERDAHESCRVSLADLLVRERRLKARPGQLAELPRDARRLLAANGVEKARIIRTLDGQWPHPDAGFAIAGGKEAPFEAREVEPRELAAVDALDNVVVSHELAVLAGDADFGDCNTRGAQPRDHADHVLVRGLHREQHQGFVATDIGVREFDARQRDVGVLRVDRHVLEREGFERRCAPAHEKNCQGDRVKASALHGRLLTVWAAIDARNGRTLRRHGFQKMKTPPHTSNVA